MEEGIVVGGGCALLYASQDLDKVKTKYAHEKVSTIDGIKIDFSDEWIHLRKSNTEPIIRIYSESTSKEKMKQTVVPNRNMVMISVAASLAIKNELDYLWYAAHSGDHEIYPDCRPEFIAKMAEVLSICDYHKINFEAPFQDLSKAEIIKVGLDMNLDYSKAWTCYEGKEKPCGKCSACLERAASFQANQVIDPLDEL